MTTSVAILGARGYGKVHLAAMTELADEGIAKVVAIADPAGVDAVANIPDDTPIFADLGALLDHVVPDVVVIATPIHTHRELAEQAMRAGSHVLVEKPTTATLAEFESMVQVAAQTSRACQVGFQSFGSRALPEIARSITSGEIGDLVSIGGIGTWTRYTSYYERARWAGRRHLDGRDVVDGVVTNPLAHAVATGLRIAGARTIDDVEDITTDLFRAHDIEADDTSAIRVSTASGLTLSFGLTLAAADSADPRLMIYGTEGELEFRYTRDELVLRVQGRREEVRTLERAGLLRNMHEHLTSGAPLVAELRDTGAFMRVLEAVRLAPDPTPITTPHATWIEDADGRRPVVHDVAQWCQRVAAEGRTFTELGAPWTLG